MAAEYTAEELSEALRIVSSVIGRCEKAQLKFAEGTSQHSLLRNRLKAMYLAQSLIAGKDVTDRYTTAELEDALRPISSSISKCEKAQMKFAQGSAQHARFRGMIKALHLSRDLVAEEIGKRG